jgi:hypothetical protein
LQVVVKTRGRDKEDRAEILHDIRQEAISLLKVETPEEFEVRWSEIQVAWVDQPNWIKYMAREWIPYKERWCHAWRKVGFKKLLFFHIY